MVVENVLQDLAFAIWFGQFDYAVDEDKILILEQHSIKTSGIGAVLNNNIVVDDWSRSIGVNDSVVNKGLFGSFSKDNEGRPPGVTLFLYVIILDPYQRDIRDLFVILQLNLLT